MNTPEKKVSERPAEPVTEQPKQLVLRPFADGNIFKFVPHPTEPGRAVLITSEGRAVGVIDGAPIADLICQAVKTLFAAVQASQDAKADQEHAATLAGEVREGA